MDALNARARARSIGHVTERTTLAHNAWEVEETNINLFYPFLIQRRPRKLRGRFVPSLINLSAWRAWFGFAFFSKNQCSFLTKPFFEKG